MGVLIAPGTPIAITGEAVTLDKDRQPIPNLWFFQPLRPSRRKKAVSSATKFPGWAVTSGGVHLKFEDLNSEPHYEGEVRYIESIESIYFNFKGGRAYQTLGLKLRPSELPLALREHPELGGRGL